LKVLIIPDKFKGTLSARAAAEAIARGWRRAQPEDSIDLLPMTMAGMVWRSAQRFARRKSSNHQNGRCGSSSVHDPVVVEPKTKTAIIESARIIGLARLPPKQFHLSHSTLLAWAVIRAAAAREHDGVCWASRQCDETMRVRSGAALGWEFRDAQGNLIEQWD